MDLSDRSTRMRVNKRFREKGVLAKVCGRCCVVRGHEAFAVDRNRCDGRRSVCRRCASSTYAAWAQSRPDHIRERAQAWREENPDYAQQWYQKNRSRVASNGRKWRAANPEAKRAQSQRRRATQAEATVEAVTASGIRQDWENHDLYACFFCGGPLTGGYEVEHFFPLRPLEGSGVPQGPHALWNLLPSCMPCNRGVGGKGTKEPWSYLRESLAEQGTDLDAAIAGLEAIAARRRRR